MNNFVQRTPDPVCIYLVSPEISKISTAPSHGRSHQLYDRFKRLCLCISFLHRPLTAPRYMVSGWGRFELCGASRLREPRICLAPFCRSWIRIARRAITFPLQAQVSTTSKLAFSRTTLANAALPITSTKKPRITAVDRRCSRATSAAIDLRRDVLALTVNEFGELLQSRT